MGRECERWIGNSLVVMIFLCVLHCVTLLQKFYVNSQHCGCLTSLFYFIPSLCLKYYVSVWNLMSLDLLTLLWFYYVGNVNQIDLFGWGKFLFGVPYLHSFRFTVWTLIMVWQVHCSGVRYRHNKISLYATVDLVYHSLLFMILKSVCIMQK